jgi:hypothetical protein
LLFERLSWASGVEIDSPATTSGIGIAQSNFGSNGQDYESETFSLETPCLKAGCRNRDTDASPIESRSLCRILLIFVRWR